MRKAAPGNQYFAEREEQAVIDYIKSNSIEEKNRIYNEILLVPFRIMTESILRRYPVPIGSYEMREVEAFALSHVIENMITYDPNRITKNGKAKAYSYCQTIIRNFYRNFGKKNYKSEKINLCFDDYMDDIEEDDEYKYEMNFDNDYPMENLIFDVIEKIDVILIDDCEILKKNEIIVGEAIITILNNWQDLFIENNPDVKWNKKVTNKFTKNKILYLLKEFTNLSAKDIRLSIKPFKDIYFMEKLSLTQLKNQ